MKVKYFLVALLGLLLFVAPAQASPVILDFNMNASHPSGASISFTPGGCLVGENIGVDYVQDLSGTYTDYSIAGAVLSFNTGTLTSSTSNTWNFGGGGSIVVQGVGTDSLIHKWLEGSFSSARVEIEGGIFKVVIASFIDKKDKDLLAHFGLPDDTEFTGYMNLSFLATGTPPGGFTSITVGSGDIINISSTGEVPIPPTVWLLGAGLVGLVGLRRKFRK